MGRRSSQVNLALDILGDPKKINLINKYLLAKKSRIHWIPVHSSKKFLCALGVSVVNTLLFSSLQNCSGGAP